MAAMAAEEIPITPDEIGELIDYLGGRHTDLAAPLGVTHATIYNWAKGLHAPPKTARMIMVQWLQEFRTKKRSPARQTA